MFHIDTRFAHRLLARTSDLALATRQTCRIYPTPLRLWQAIAGYKTDGPALRLAILFLLGWRSAHDYRRIMDPNTLNGIEARDCPEIRGWGKINQCAMAPQETNKNTEVDGRRYP